MVMSMYIAARNEAIENLPAKSKIMPMHSAIEFGPLSVPYLQRFVRRLDLCAPFLSILFDDVVQLILTDQPSSSLP